MSDATLNRANQVLSRDGKSVALTREQARILVRVIDRAGWSVSADSLDEMETKRAHVHICKIRQRCAAGGVPDPLVTLHAVGYALAYPVRIIGPDDAVVLRGEAVSLLRRLLQRCAERPADSSLAERLRQVAFGA